VYYPGGGWAMILPVYGSDLCTLVDYYYTAVLLYDREQEKTQHRREKKKIKEMSRLL
jgi:hypothetical protein